MLRFAPVRSAEPEAPKASDVERESRADGVPAATPGPLWSLNTLGTAAGQSEESRGDRSAPFGTIVEDDVAPRAGQITRAAFVARATALIEAVATRELARVGRSTRDCPYLAFYLRYYQGRPAAHLERTLAKYARPASVDPDGLLAALEARAREALVRWIQTGQLDVPAEASAVPGAPRLPRVLGFDGPLAADPHAVRAGLGAGQPLDSSTRARMERGFGTDFSDVRVHDDAHAARSAERLSARAFTVGTDVAFGAQQYRPGTARGDLMLAHELAHVVQQRGAEAAPQAFSAAADDALEVDADRSAISAAARAGLAPEAIAQHVDLHRPAAGGGLRLARCQQIFGDADETFVADPGLDEAVATELSPLYEGARRPTMPGESESEGLGSTRPSFFLIDGDGDGAAELKVWFETTELVTPPHQSFEKIKTARMTVQQLSTQQTQTVDLDCGDLVDRYALHPRLDDASDGFNPTVIRFNESYGTWATLELDPPRDPASAAEYAWRWSVGPPAGLGRAVTSSGKLAFGKREPQLFNVWQPDDPRTAAGIWTIDANVGPYAERFRFTFVKADPSSDVVTVAVSAFGTDPASQTSTPFGAQSTDTVRCADPLAVKIVENSGGKLGLDLSGKGCRIDLFDRFEGGHEGMDVGWYLPNESRNRTHTFSVVQAGTAHGFGNFKVEDGKLESGYTTGGSKALPAASSAVAIDVLEPLVAQGFDYSRELAAVLKARSDARARAVKAGAIDAGTNDAFDTLAKNWAFLAAQLGLQALKQTSDVPGARRELLKAAAAYRPLLLAQAPVRLEGEKLDRMYSARTSHLRSRFTGQLWYAPHSVERNWKTPSDITDTSSLTSAEGPTIDAFTAAIDAGNWAEASVLFQTLSTQIDLWVADGLATKQKPEDAAQLEALTQLSGRMRTLTDKKPVVVHAVFHVDEQYRKAGRISPADNLPLRLYAWHDSDTWYLEDLTDPRRDFKDHCPYTAPAAGQPDEPPLELFKKLNWKEHFPKGFIHYVLPSGAFNRVETTADPEWSDYLAYAATALALAGLVVATAGAGAPAAGAVATGLFVTSGIASAAGSIAHLHELADHGHRDPAQEALDVLNIVASLAGAGTLASRAVLTAGRTANTAKVAGSALAAKNLAATGLRVLSVVTVATDAANLVVATVDFVKEYDAISDAPMGESEKLQARALLVLRYAGTSALTVFSIKGAVEDIHLAIKAGRALKLDVLTGGVAGEKGIADIRPDWAASDYEQAFAERVKGTPAEEWKGNVKVVDDPEEWKRLTSGSELGTAVVRNEGGTPILYVRQGAHPSRIAEEAIHFAQFKDPKLKPFFDKLDEATLARWPKLKPAERIELVKAKLQLEVDAQRKVIADLEKRAAAGSHADFAALDDAWQNLDHLQGKFLDTLAFNAKDLEALQAAGGQLPELLEDVPRLFAKKTTAAFSLDESWRTLSEDAFVKAYEARYPNTSLSEADLRQRYQSSKRLSPDSWRLVDVDRAPPPKPSVTAEYEGAARTYTAKDSPTNDALSFGYTERKEFDEAFRKRDAARKKAQELRNDPHFETDPKVEEAWGKQMNEMRTQSRIIGERAAMSAVEKEVAHELKEGTKLELVYGGPGKASRSGDFDLVYAFTKKDGTKVAVVVEAKGGASELGAAWASGEYVQQGTAKYFDYVMGKMRTGTTEMQTTAKAIKGADEIRYLHVKAKIPTDVSGASVPGDVVVSTFKLPPR